MHAVERAERALADTLAWVKSERADSERRRSAAVAARRRRQRCHEINRMSVCASASRRRTVRCEHECTYTIPAQASELQSRIADISWPDAASEPDAHGAATIERLLTPAQCGGAGIAVHPRRSFQESRRDGAAWLRPRRVPPYLRYPLPPLIAELRVAFYEQLVPMANRWHEAMGIAVRFPDRHAAFICALPRCRPDASRRRCCCSTARATTTACTRISTASTSSRCRWRSCCRSPGAISTGGEFVMTEQRPRMQSRADGACRCSQGDACSDRGAPPAGAGHARLSTA